MDINSRALQSDDFLTAGEILEAVIKIKDRLGTSKEFEEVLSAANTVIHITGSFDSRAHFLTEIRRELMFKRDLIIENGNAPSSIISIVNNFQLLDAELEHFFELSKSIMQAINESLSTKRLNRRRAIFIAVSSVWYDAKKYNEKKAKDYFQKHLSPEYITTISHCIENFSVSRNSPATGNPPQIPARINQCVLDLLEHLHGRISRLENRYE